MSSERQFWIRYTPAGCAVGSVWASSVGPLAEDAHREFTPRVADRRREAAEGWRFELVDHAGFTAVLPCLRGKCNHPAPPVPPPPPARGRCTGCGRQYRLRVDGRIRHHLDYGYRDCPGARQFPKGDK